MRVDADDAEHRECRQNPTDVGSPDVGRRFPRVPAGARCLERRTLDPFACRRNDAEGDSS